MKKITELKQRGIRASLREAFESQSLLRLWRFSNEAASFTGYVVGMGKEFLLLWVLGDYIGFDGMYVLRYRDITGMESPDKNAGFLIKAMNLKQVKTEFPKDFVLDDVEGVIKSASGKAPLIAVHVDSESDMEVCYIGRLLSFEPDGFLLQEISPDAEWQTEASFFAFEEVSAVAFDGPYLDVLAQVAGVPPQDILPFSRDQELVP